MENQNEKYIHPKELLNVSVLQFAPEWENKTQNLDKIELLINDCDADTNLIVLPEMATTGFSMHAAALAEEMDGKTVAKLSLFAQKKQLAICGSFIIQETTAFYNRFLFFHPNGKIDKYDKKHLFTMASENASYKAGSDRILIEYLGWKILPTICYDIRFPIWCRNNLNYDLLLCVANWPNKRTFVWETLLKARALENQCYTIGCNRVGSDKNSVEYDGNSLIISAKGNVVSGAKNEEQIISASLDKNTQMEFRKAFPVLNDADGFQII